MTRDGRREGYKSLVRKTVSEESRIIGGGHSGQPKYIKTEPPRCTVPFGDAIAPHARYSRITIGEDSPLGPSPVSQRSERDINVHKMADLGRFLRFYQVESPLAEQPHPSAKATRGPAEQG